MIKAVGNAQASPAPVRRRGMRRHRAVRAGLVQRDPAGTRTAERGHSAVSPPMSRWNWNGSTHHYPARRTKQNFAERFRLQLKDKIWKGIRGIRRRMGIGKFSMAQPGGQGTNCAVETPRPGRSPGPDLEPGPLLIRDSTAGVERTGRCPATRPTVTWTGNLPKGCCWVEHWRRLRDPASPEEDRTGPGLAATCNWASLCHRRSGTGPQPDPPAHHRPADVGRRRGRRAAHLSVRAPAAEPRHLAGPTCRLQSCRCNCAAHARINRHPPANKSLTRDA